jgi:carbonyl reductase 1
MKKKRERFLIVHQILSSSLRREFDNIDQLTEVKIDLYVNQFLQDFYQGTARSKGWPSGAYAVYSMSKLALNAYTRGLARDLQNQAPDHRICVNCMHPGYVQTDMTGHRGYFSPEEGADTAVWLALHPLPSPTGKLFYQRKSCSF